MPPGFCWYNATVSYLQSHALHKKARLLLLAGGLVFAKNKACRHAQQHTECQFLYAHRSAPDAAAYRNNHAMHRHRRRAAINVKACPSQAVVCKCHAPLISTFLMRKSESAAANSCPVDTCRTPGCAGPAALASLTASAINTALMIRPELVPHHCRGIGVLDPVQRRQARAYCTAHTGAATSLGSEVWKVCAWPASQQRPAPFSCCDGAPHPCCAPPDAPASPWVTTALPGRNKKPYELERVSSTSATTVTSKVLEPVPSSLRVRVCPSIGMAIYAQLGHRHLAYSVS